MPPSDNQTGINSPKLKINSANRPFHKLKLQEMLGDSGEPDEAENLSSPEPRTKAFTGQVLLQILSVSLLKFQKVSSDSIMPTFLASPSTASSAPPSLQPRNFFETTCGFGYSSQKVGLILLSQAVVALVAQATVVPISIEKLGTLKSYRIVLSIYLATYIFTPLLPKLMPPFPLVSVTLDLWMKVTLSSIGYICSAIL